MFDIKKVGIEQLETIYSLAHYIWPLTYSEMLPADQLNYMLNLIYSKDALEHQFKEQQHQFIIAYYDDEPTGFASYSVKSPQTPAIFKLHKIYLDPKLHGKGYGNRLLQYILNEAELAGATNVELNVNRKNNALSFYKKAGFTINNETDIDIGNGYFMNDYIMVYSL